MGSRQALFLLAITITLALALFALLLGVPARDFPQLPSLVSPNYKSTPASIATATNGASHPSSTTTILPEPLDQANDEEKTVNMTLKANKFTPE